LPEQIRRCSVSGLQVQGGFIVGFDTITIAPLFRPGPGERQMAMVGLLQAAAARSFLKRLKQEGRLSASFQATMSWRHEYRHADGPTRRSTLRSSYRALVKALYERRITTTGQEFAGATQGAEGEASVNAKTSCWLCSGVLSGWA